MDLRYLGDPQYPADMSVLIAFSILWVSVRETVAQIPSVCADNVTRSGICCPKWNNDSVLICGGYDRGRCVRLHSGDDVSSVPHDYLHDDRIYWPTRLVKFACECYGNYAGYACQECRDGFKGDDCSERIVRIRRNLKSLTLPEKQYLVQVMNAARYTVSDYVILNMTHSSDPVTDPQFMNASVFDYLGYLHHYASRLTNLKDGKTCLNATFRIDCAHRGSNFPIWHRYYMLVWEREMRKVSGDENFTFPYWNWIDGGVTCELCTDDFLGNTNMSDPDKTIRRTNIISTWYAMCYIINECETCDPSIQFALVRNPGNNKEDAPRLPTKAEVAAFMALDSYDFPDYKVGSRAESFRSRLEGFATERGPTSDLKMHNLVHAFMNGSFSGALTSSFDPVFYFHHSFMDKLLETWLRRTGAGPQQLPSVGANPGHNRDSYLVSFIPVAKASWYFTSCRNLGYDYDDMTDTYLAEDIPNETDENEGINATSNEFENDINVTETLNTTSSAAVTMATESSGHLDEVNPLLRYLIIEGGIIAILLVALISECSFRFRYFLTHQGYQKLKVKNKNEQIYSEISTDKPSYEDESDCE